MALSADVVMDGSNKKLKLSDQAQASHHSSIMEPRRYQIDALDKALKENVILYLETGSGKTYIAVLLIKSVEERLSMPSMKRIAVFLAPTVHLVVQQARVISVHTELKIGVYYGAKGVDSWSITDWQEEVNSHQVLVMTPQVFLNALNTSALKMEIIELLIIDECHHAQKSHPYALVMKLHYHTPSLKSKPKVLGMTASPIIKKGISSSFDCIPQIQNLENILDSKVYTLEDRTELEAVAPTPNQQVKFYNKSTCDFAALRDRLAELQNQYADQQNICIREGQFNDDKKLKERTAKSIKGLHGAIDHCLSDLGLLGASLAVDALLKTDKEVRVFEWDPTEHEEEENHKRRFLNEASAILSHVVQGSACLYERVEDLKLPEKSGFVSSKVELLVNVLMGYRDVENMRCIVFVERVIVCIVLAKLIKHFKFLEFVHGDYMAGVNADLCSKTSHQQQETVDYFSEGKLNLVIATSVAEEGLDVQKCSSVVRFDLCQTLRSHIQSRGRARRSGSNYIWFLESENVTQEELLLQIMESEKVMKEEVLSRAKMDVHKEPPVDGDLEIFRVESGACRSTEDSVSFIHQYCARLPGDRYYNPQPGFVFKKNELGEELYVCTVKFPPNSPLHLVEGPPRRSEQLSKKAACLKACEQLYAIGAVRGDTLCPDVEEIDEEDQLTSKNPSGPGTSKLKELYSSVKPAACQGTWLESVTGADLQLYVLSFLIEPPELQTYTRFAFIIEGVLDHDVANVEMELYAPSNRVVKAKLYPSGQIQLDINQLKAAKAYHELLLNGAFNRLTVREKDAVKCLLTSEETKKELWNKSEVYLLLPMSNDDIDWKSVFATAEASRVFLNHISCPSAEVDSVNDTIDLSMLHTGGGQQHVSALQDCLVLTMHTGKLFSVTEILCSVNAESPFPAKKHSEPCTYTEYYKTKYGKQLKFPSQPLFKAKQIRPFRNLLVRREADGNPVLGNEAITDNGNSVELPPELCLVLGLKSSVTHSLYFVPTFMHRLTSMICASQLRATIAKMAPGCPWIPALQIVQALTSKKCQEAFSFEGLELLGDSFLKYAVTQRLFLVYNNKHEGQLTARRSHAICNATLNNLAKLQGFPAYIRDEVFDPYRWVAPGMYPPEALVCQHDMSKLVSNENDPPTGRTCIEGHRWIRSKITADIVEALIGAYLVNSGHEGAIEFMKMIGIDVEFDPCLINLARQRSLPSEAAHKSLESLEEKLCYKFQNKALLLEAITHASEPNSNVCYQRLEFLGDGALDFLISEHIFKAHPGLPPGRLTDLRSAAVNNGCFARVTEKHGLHLYLRHGSAELHKQVTAFVQALKDNFHGPLFGFEGMTGPKVLGDLVESIAGAILVDTGFDLQRLWKVMEPLLSPIVTPEAVPLEPIRELHELCSSKKFEFRWNIQSKSDMNVTIAEVIVNAGYREFVEASQQKQKKAAKKEAAQKMLATMQRHGFKHPGFANTFNSTQLASSVAGGTTMQREATSSHGGSFESSNGNHGQTQTNVRFPSLIKQIDTENLMNIDATSALAPSGVLQHQANTPSLLLPDLISSRIEQPGGARSFLYELCTKRRWEQPKFEKKESVGLPHMRRFIYSLTIDIPNGDCYQKESCLMSDKKKAMDDAAKKMVVHLRNLGITG